MSSLLVFIQEGGDLFQFIQSIHSIHSQISTSTPPMRSQPTQVEKDIARSQAESFGLEIQFPDLSNESQQETKEPVFNRLLEFGEKKEKKIKESLQIKARKDMEECTFSPQLVAKQPPNVAQRRGTPVHWQEEHHTRPSSRVGNERNGEIRKFNQEPSPNLNQTPFCEIDHIEPLRFTKDQTEFRESINHEIKNGRNYPGAASQSPNTVQVRHANVYDRLYQIATVEKRGKRMELDKRKEEQDMAECTFSPKTISQRHKSPSPGFFFPLPKYSKCFVFFLFLSLFFII